MKTVTGMTYNVRHAVLDDGENAWENRREGVSERIQTAAPDIVSVQECTGDQHTELAADLPAYEWVGVADDPGSGEHTPIGYDDSWECERTKTVWLSESGAVASVGWDAEYPRVLTKATFRSRTDGTILTVFNTHFDHIGEQAQIESARLVRREIDSIPMERPAIALGDFNVEPGTKAYDTLVSDEFDRNLLDARTAAKETAGPTTTVTDFDSPGTRVLDHVLVTDGWHIRQYSVDDTKVNGTYPSDHLPVVVTVEY
jgi:endonuclease/exonuclease/phosphatase family metal-dependent hydrolase